MLDWKLGLLFDLLHLLLFQMYLFLFQLLFVWGRRVDFVLWVF